MNSKNKSKWLLGFRAASSFVVLIVVLVTIQTDVAQADECCSSPKASDRFGLPINHDNLTSAARNSIGGEKYLNSFLDKNIELPAEFDWRLVQPSRLSPVQDQFTRNCWAYAVTALLESFQHHLGIKPINGQPWKFSEQFLTECSEDRTNYCLGAWPANTLEWVVKNGIKLERDYVTDAACYGSCRATSGQPIKLKLKGQITRDIAREGEFTEEKLRKLLVTFGPVLVTMTLRTDKYHRPLIGSIEELSTESPISNLGESGDDWAGHAVLLVGYGTDGYGNKYWTVKNSWGPKAGTGGYYFLHRENYTNKRYRPFDDMTIPYI